MGINSLLKGGIIIFCFVPWFHSMDTTAISSTTIESIRDYIFELFSIFLPNILPSQIKIIIEGRRKWFKKRNNQLNVEYSCINLIVNY